MAARIASFFLPSTSVGVGRAISRAHATNTGATGVMAEQNAMGSTSAAVNVLNIDSTCNARSCIIARTVSHRHTLLAAVFSYLVYRRSPPQERVVLPSARVGRVEQGEHLTFSRLGIHQALLICPRRRLPHPTVVFQHNRFSLPDATSRVPSRTALEQDIYAAVWLIGTVASSGKATANGLPKAYE